MTRMRPSFRRKKRFPGRLSAGGPEERNDFEGALQKGLGDLRDLMLLQILFEAGFLERVGQLPELGEKKPSLRIAKLEGIEQLGRDEVVLLTGVDCSRQGGDDIPLHDFGEEGEGLVAEAVAGVAGILIGGVFAVGDVLFGKVAVDLGAPGMEKGSQEDKFLLVDEKLALQLHPFESCGTTQEIEETGFGLVFGVMGEENTVAARGARGLGEKLMAGVPRGGFERVSFLFGAGGDVGFLQSEREVVVLGELLHEEGVAFGFLAAELMVEMDEVEVTKSMGKELMKQRDGIPPPGNSEEIACVGR